MTILPLSKRVMVGDSLGWYAQAEESFDDRAELARHFLAAIFRDALSQSTAFPVEPVSMPVASPLSFHPFRVLTLLAMGLAQLSNAIALADVDPLDWPNWLGPQQNHTSSQTNLVETWDPQGGEGSNLLWKNAELGGRSTPIVMDGKLYTIVRDQPGTATEGEKVVCVDATTGEKLWQHRFNVYLSDVPDTRVGWSCCVGDPETGRVYAQGVCGYFCCLEGETGELVWSRSLHEELGFLSTYGGRTNVPIIYQDTVITSAVVIGWGDTPKWGLLAKPAHRFMAFDKANGELRWLEGTRLIPDDTTYSTPTVAELGGQDAMVFGSGDGQVWALQPGTGKPIWNYELSRRGLNVSPLVAPDGRVYTGHSEENIIGNTMGSVVALDGNMTGDLTGKEIWRHYQIMVGKSSPLLVDDRVYFIDDRAKMWIYEADTGKLVQRKPLGTVMRSTPLYADGKFYLCTNNGRWWTLRPTQRGVEDVYRMRLDGEASDGSPIVSHGRIYVPTSEYLYCVGNDASIAANQTAPRTDERPSSPARRPAAKAVHIQVVPYDTLLRPAEAQQYTVRLFDEQGQFIREARAAEVRFAVDGPGSISSDGTYTSAAGAEHECALVTCQVGELEGWARVRIVPPLPWKFAFDNRNDVPLTWVGGRIRYVLKAEGDGKIMVKPTELPTRPGGPTTKLGTRSQMWMGPVELSNYTMQADVMLPIGAENDDPADASDLPEYPTASAAASKQGDIGLINSRYIFSLYGASQEVRLDSWNTHDKRTQAALPFDIDPETWYTLKVLVEADDDAAIVRGKVWRTDEPEPEEWTLEMVDPAPNRNGSPGLFGNSKDAEIFVDNILVTGNDAKLAGPNQSAL